MSPKEGSRSDGAPARRERVRAVLAGPIDGELTVSGLCRAAHVPRPWLYTQRDLIALIDAERRRGAHETAARSGGTPAAVRQHWDATSAAIADAERLAADGASDEGFHLADPGRSRRDGDGDGRETDDDRPRPLLRSRSTRQEADSQELVDLEHPVADDADPVTGSDRFPASWPAVAPTTFVTVRPRPDWLTQVRVAVDAPGSVLTEAAREDAETAGALAYARAAADPRAPVSDRALDTARQTAADHAQRSAAMEHAGRAGSADDPTRWLPRAGHVVPIVGGAAGVGTSVVAAALFDALDAAGMPTLLVDAADPARSGLATASPEGRAVRQLAPDLAISYARRGGGYVTRLNAPAREVVTMGMVPGPLWWLPTSRPPQVTVVDLGWDPWEVAAHPLRGPGSWLERMTDLDDDSDEEQTTAQRSPVLVCQATRPSLAHAEQTLCRLAPWVRARQVDPVSHLVVSGAKRWPRGVDGVGGRELTALGAPTFMPHDREVAIAGVGPGPLPRRVVAAARLLADRLGLL